MSVLFTVYQIILEEKSSISVNLQQHELLASLMLIKINLNFIDMLRFLLFIFASTTFNTFSYLPVKFIHGKNEGLLWNWNKNNNISS